MPIPNPSTVTSSSLFSRDKFNGRFLLHLMCCLHVLWGLVPFFDVSSAVAPFPNALVAHTLEARTGAAHYPNAPIYLQNTPAELKRDARLARLHPSIDWVVP